ncbi:MAG: alanine--tRNA ligase [Bacteroidota bacterium]|nr:alanine--tRNA ligase [Bacteroidota bacterium]
MNSSEIRQKFFDFFESKKHKIVPSAPMVVKNDPTLMFINAGMNQFKDYFLGNSKATNSRVADTQKCLRVSGKHNDLEEVGRDTYHHTMFEMLGNWSFGDYFKKEAIEWAWELLTDVYGIEKDRLYATYFGGDKKDSLEADEEALGYWEKLLPKEQILSGSKKDNFWEMGDTGPCGPCSEIHVDIRSEKDRAKVKGRELVNKDHPEVIEIWNLVFIQYNRLSDSTLKMLPQKHVDTGMGFERLCMILQGVKSNYDTDIFVDLIKEISSISGIKYGKDKSSDIAMRVVSDHLRAIAFSISDGQLPSNNMAGYVIRRILRRAVRYGYTFLNQKEAFIYKLVSVLTQKMGEQFPELKKQKTLIEKVIKEEEANFLRTLETGIKLLNRVVKSTKGGNIIDGKTVFELYDTFGFPVDLTELILQEKGLKIDHSEFEKELQKQKERSRNASSQETSDWQELVKEEKETEFTGYDSLEEKIKIIRYRKIIIKKKEKYQFVFNKTPFYAESGGQVGDTGYIEKDDKKISVIDTIKENNLTVHITNKIPENLEGEFLAVVNKEKRIETTKNHSVTHLFQQALRKILGTHIEQKGSFVNHEHLRFDFSHFQKISDEEIKEIEIFVNNKIQQNISLEEKREIPIQKAKDMGAIALFGEKYGDEVRVVKYGESVELCGGTHVQATGQIGLFKIIAESSIAAGIRRIEAISGTVAFEYFQQQQVQLKEINSILDVNPKNTTKAIANLIKENKNLSKENEAMKKEKVVSQRKELILNAEKINDINLVVKVVNIDSATIGKDLSFELKRNLDRSIVILGATIKDKANLWVIISDELVKEKDLDASQIIREISKEIQGGGGGQAFFATAGGKNPRGIDKALQMGREIVLKKIQ